MTGSVLGCPVDERVNLGELVTVFLDVLVGFSEHVGSEGVHGGKWITVIYKLTRGGTKQPKTKG